jgi:hypothetical protein
VVEATQGYAACDIQRAGPDDHHQANVSGFIKAAALRMPAPGQYDWEDTPSRKQPHYFARRAGQVMTFVAIHDTLSDRATKVRLRPCSMVGAQRRFQTDRAMDLAASRRVATAAVALQRKGKRQMSHRPHITPIDPAIVGAGMAASIDRAAAARQLPPAPTRDDYASAPQECGELTRTCHIKRSSTDWGVVTASLALFLTFFGSIFFVGLFAFLFVAAQIALYATNATIAGMRAREVTARVAKEILVDADSVSVTGSRDCLQINARYRSGRWQNGQAASRCEATLFARLQVDLQRIFRPSGTQVTLHAVVD